VEAASLRASLLWGRLRRRDDLPVLALLAALLAAAILLIALNWPLTYFQDAWAFLMERRPWTSHSLLTPQNEHLVVLQVVALKFFADVFGIGNNHAEMLFNVAAMLASAALLFVYARRHVQDWVAFFAACLLLFCGAAWQVLLWPFEMEFTVPLAAGIGMLLALDRDDERGDFLALVLLLVAIGFGSFGLSFGFAALVDVCQKRRRRSWGRLWIVAIPFVLYLGWYAGWGHEAAHHLTLRNILASPLYVFEGVAAAIGSVAGLTTSGTTGTPDPIWGRPLLIGLVGLAIWAKRRRPGFDPAFWPVLAVALSYWLLAAFNYIPGREAGVSRYQYSGAALILLVAVHLLRGWRFSPRGLWVAAAVTAVMLGPNLALLGSGYEWFKEQALLTRADIGALEIAEPQVEPYFRLAPEFSGTPSLINIDAENLEGAVEEHGRAGYSPDELAAAEPLGRHWADVVLSKALRLSTVTELEGWDPAAAAGEGCTAVPAGGVTVPEVGLATGVNRVYVAPGGEAELSMRRFSTGEYPVPLASAPGGSMVEIKVPKDDAPGYPWFVHVVAGQEAAVCPATPPGA
jgi:hypothetical protein